LEPAVRTTDSESDEVESRRRHSCSVRDSSATSRRRASSHGSSVSGSLTTHCASDGFFALSKRIAERSVEHGVSRCPSQFSSHLLSLSVGVNKTTVGLVVTSTGWSQSTRFGCHVLRNMGVVSQKSKGRPRAADAPEHKDQMGAVRGLRLARTRHKSRNDAGPMRWRVFSADVTRAKKRKGCAAQKSGDV